MRFNFLSIKVMTCIWGRMPCSGGKAKHPDRNKNPIRMWFHVAY
jgi:hypothetical protein